MNTIRPKYKKLVLDITQIDQILSYLALAKHDIAQHAEKDLQDLRKEVHKQLGKQNFKRKKDC